jgi:predicted TIM-barrel fold metal-dependent hydrolase
MKRILFLFVYLPALYANSQQVETLLLKDYQPIPYHKIPKTTIEKAKFPVVDMHSHVYASSLKEIDQWLANMEKFGIEKTILLTGATGNKFDSLYAIYSKYQGRFELWCGFDYTGYNEAGYPEKAVKELERCFKAGATGVGELGDKGVGLMNSHPTRGFGLHIDDPRLQPLIQKCGELGMPINVHVAEPYWMYLPMDAYNDGLMNAYKWRIDTTEANRLFHAELISTLEHAVRDNPGTTFIACHIANCSHDLSIISALFDQYPNLYADIAARYAEIAPVPKYARAFIEKYSDRLVYGTDMGFDKSMYATTFRILESGDEHFYDSNLFSYHWPLNGFELSDETLMNLYHKNARNILEGK